MATPEGRQAAGRRVARIPPILGSRTAPIVRRRMWCLLFPRKMPSGSCFDSERLSRTSQRHLREVPFDTHSFPVRQRRFAGLVIGALRSSPKSRLDEVRWR